MVPTSLQNPRHGVQPSFVLAGGFVFITLYLFLLGWASQHTSYDTWGALVVGPILMALVVPLALHAARLESDRVLARMIVTAFILKLLGSVVRYIVTYDVYQRSDAKAYHQAGEALARRFRDGNFDLGDAALSGTRFIEVLTGTLYTLLGTTKLGGFFVFSWLAFVGCYLFYRAFRIAVPEADHRRYALLMFFLPSMLYWSASVGKETWMTLTLGLASYGTARVLVRGRGGFTVLFLGLAAAGLVRSHIAVLVAGAAIVAYPFRRGKGTRASPLVKVVGLVLLLASSVAVFGQLQQRAGIEGVSQESLEALLNEAEGQTAQGGSRFVAPRVRTPLDFPFATVTVLFRPFPAEATNAQSLAASLEGVLLITVFVVGWRRLRSAARQLPRAPYLIYAAVFTVGFVVGFSSVGNFGILSRQRVQVLPFVLAFVALPPRPRRGENPAEERATEAPPVPEPATPTFAHPPARRSPPVVSPR